jgi:hypothetical protein
MRYFVIGPNQELYGPADVPTLNQWITEGRLTPTTTLQEEQGGARFAASMITGLNFPANYVRPGMGTPYAAVDDGSQEMKTAWICWIVGIFCFGIILGPVGLFSAIKAKNKGNSQAVGGIILCSITTGLSAIGIIIMASGALR